VWHISSSFKTFSEDGGVSFLCPSTSAEEGEGKGAHTLPNEKVPLPSPCVPLFLRFLLGRPRRAVNSVAVWLLRLSGRPVGCMEEEREGGRGGG